MRKLSKGQFEKVKVAQNSPLAELTNSFNSMSSDMQQKIQTLESLACVDREIASTNDIDFIMEKIILRIENLLPESCIALLRLEEKNDGDSQFIANASKHFELASNRITLKTHDVNLFKSIPNGQFIAHSELASWQFNRIFQDCHSAFYWAYPIFWQGEFCAIMAMKKPTAYTLDSLIWDEVRQLANRVGIASAAQVREERLLVQAQYDHLTGLPNRILLYDRLKLAIEHSAYTNSSFWVAMIDLDRFKAVNDSLGHKAGNQILQTFAMRLQDAVQELDTVARTGGDSFVIILQGEMNEHLRMNMLHQLMKMNEQPISVDNQEIVVSASIGISVYPSDSQKADELLSLADVAMYRAKEKGKNNFQFYKQSINNRVIDRLQMEMHLRKAIELNEFELRYQPKVSLVTNEIVGMEALITWKNETFGLVPTHHFIPLAEETGLIVEIGEWALKTACAQTVLWQKQGFKSLLVSVNLSARQFQQKDLTKAINQTLIETGLPAQNLELELTESLVMSNVKHSMEVLNAIKATGVQLSIDDFGTGYSSLSYLNTLPIHTIKIDKSFIDDIHHHNDQSPIVASIITLAKNLDLKVVAEGVEEFEQLQYLKAHGCHEIQGYYFSRPQNAHAFEAMLKSGITMA
jgi:diguanylate cyclase (GGDEF)-like protein